MREGLRGDIKAGIQVKMKDCREECEEGAGDAVILVS